MHGDPHRYLQLDHQSLFDQRYHMRKDDAVCWIWKPPQNPTDPYRHLPH
jgi:hypothetical protein